ncbi:hypothetical protein [Ramlibacter sp.]|uniref:hypothetical protein n=1 Tax=Ramlibacter sp. TaxID=1917967 RepID=UPI003D0AE5DD
MGAARGPVSPDQVLFDTDPLFLRVAGSLPSPQAQAFRDARYELELMCGCLASEVPQADRRSVVELCNRLLHLAGVSRRLADTPDDGTRARAALKYIKAHVNERAAADYSPPPKNGEVIADMIRHDLSRMPKWLGRLHGLDPSMAADLRPVAAELQGRVESMGVAAGRNDVRLLKDEYHELKRIVELSAADLCANLRHRPPGSLRNELQRTAALLQEMLETLTVRDYELGRLIDDPGYEAHVAMALRMARQPLDVVEEES